MQFYQKEFFVIHKNTDCPNTSSTLSFAGSSTSYLSSFISCFLGRSGPIKPKEGPAPHTEINCLLTQYLRTATTLVASLQHPPEECTLPNQQQVETFIAQMTAPKQELWVSCSALSASLQELHLNLERNQHTLPMHSSGKPETTHKPKKEGWGGNI